MMFATYCPRVSPSVRGSLRVSTKFWSRNTVCQILNILQVTSWLVELFQAKYCLQNDVRKILSASVRECTWVSASVRRCSRVSTKFCSRNTVCQIQVTSWLVELFQGKCCLQNDVRKILSTSVPECPRVSARVCGCPRVSVGVCECPWVSASVREILFTKYCLQNSSDKLISWTISREMLSAKWCPQNTVHECPRVSVGVRECPRNFDHEILSAKLQIFFKWQVD